MAVEKTKESKKAKVEPKLEGNIVIVRIRGVIGVNENISRTLNQLKLFKKNFCAVIPNNKINKGMVLKVKDYVTWGSIDDETYKILVREKSEEYKDRLTDKKEKIKYNRFLEVDGKKIKKFFRLNSPKKGYGKKGIKIPFVKGGALGDRKEKINGLIKRMIQ